MLMEGNPRPQGSVTSTYGESTGMETTSLLGLSGLQNPDKAGSFSPPNFIVTCEAITMDIDDVAQPINDPVAV